MNEMLKEIKRLNDNLEDLVEVARDFNQLIYRYFGGKVKYKQREVVEDEMV